MFKRKPYTKDFLIKTFEEWITERDAMGKLNPDVIKKYIFTVATIFPELNILSIANEIINDEINFTETYTEEEFDIFLSNYFDMCIANNNIKDIFALTYKFVRYANATLRLGIKLISA